MKKKFLRVLLLLSLFSSLAFTAPVYVDCQNPEPDETLDFFGICISKTTLNITSKTQPAAFSGSIPNSHTFDHYYTGGLSLQFFVSASALSVPLRC